MTVLGVLSSPGLLLQKVHETRRDKEYDVRSVAETDVLSVSTCLVVTAAEAALAES